jgi:hypothetical protein
MKSRALVHSKYESRVLGARPQPSTWPPGTPSPGPTMGPTSSQPPERPTSGKQSRERLPAVAYQEG